MSYRFKRSESVAHGLRRIAVEQIDKAVGEIEDDDLDRHEAVHQVRKRFKKIRGLVRIVRPALGEQYGATNAWYRDVGRRLSEIRDATTLIECFDELTESASEVLQESAVQSIHDRLIERRTRIEASSTSPRQTLDELTDALRDQRQQVEGWSLDEEGFDAIEGGLGKTFGRGIKALHRARETATDEDLHDWRKRVKYHWYHTRLLRNLWPDMLKARSSVLDQLSDLLGDDHDLAVLRQTMDGSPELFGDTATHAVLQGLIERRRAELQRQAFTVGFRIYAETARRFTQRCRVWWDVWQAEK